MSEQTFQAPGMAEFLAEQKVELEELVYESKALKEPVRVRRWTVFAPP